MRLTAAALALAACSAPAGPPLELAVVVLGADLVPAVAESGARVALVKPPQGGRVIYAGVRARNLEAGTAQLVGALRDPSSHAVLGLEGRPVVFDGGGDGWAAASEPAQPSSYANVAVCPNQRSDRDIDEQPYELYLRLTDGAGRSAEAMVNVVPFCAEPDNADECRCICRAGYVLGSGC